MVMKKILGTKIFWTNRLGNYFSGKWIRKNGREWYSRTKIKTWEQKFGLDYPFFQL